ncbi:hypothetical protein JXB28_04735 [Candidatus Woesearchaeota archaeon]|nr:hypothetical protein [Candidatus Woesearchaeota archaeon]
MLDELIKDMEMRAPEAEKESPSFGHKLRYLQGLFEATEQLGKLSLKVRDGQVDRYFCYDHKHNAGHVIEKNHLGISMVSYGNISKEDFIKKHFRVGAEEPEDKQGPEDELMRADKLKSIPYQLMTMPFIFVPGAFYALKKYYEHKKEKDSE